MRLWLPANARNKWGEGRGGGRPAAATEKAQWVEPQGGLGADAADIGRSLRSPSKVDKGWWAPPHRFSLNPLKRGLGGAVAMPERTAEVEAPPTILQEIPWEFLKPSSPTNSRRGRAAERRRAQGRKLSDDAEDGGERSGGESPTGRAAEGGFLKQAEASSLAMGLHAVRAPRTSIPGGLWAQCGPGGGGCHDGTAPIPCRTTTVRPRGLGGRRRRGDWARAAARTTSTGRRWRGTTAAPPHPRPPPATPPSAP